MRGITGCRMRIKGCLWILRGADEHQNVSMDQQKKLVCFSFPSRGWSSVWASYPEIRSAPGCRESHWSLWDALGDVLLGDLWVLPSMWVLL